MIRLKKFSVTLFVGLFILSLLLSCAPRAIRRCPVGHHWVPGHHAPSGQWIRGHCKRN